MKVIAGSFVVPILFGVITLAPVSSSSAALLAYEGFDYPVGESVVGQTGGTGFANAWQLNNSNGLQTNQAASLNYTDGAGNRLMTSGGSLFLQGITTGTSGNTQPNRAISTDRGTNSGAADGVTTWVSLLEVRVGPTTNNLVAPNNPYPRSANVSLYIGPSLAEKLAMGNTSDTVSNVVTLLPVGVNPQPTTVDFSRTNFIVARIDHKVGEFDDAYLFVNPPLGTEPNTASANATSLGQFDFSFNRIRPFAGGNRATQPYAELIVDEIRVGETFADVTPFVSPLTVTRLGSEVVLNWTGAAFLQSASNVEGPYSTIVNATSPYTNNVPDPLQFFRLSSVP